MSRIGKQPIEIPGSVDVKVDAGAVTVKGPKGELTQRVSPALRFDRQESNLTVQRPTDRPEQRCCMR